MHMKKLQGCYIRGPPILQMRHAKCCRGYRGRVVSATDTDVRIELEAQYKTVTVKKEQLKGQEAAAGASGGYSAPARPPAPWTQTQRSMPTPLHGSATPMHPSATPMHPGERPPQSLLIRVAGSSNLTCGASCILISDSALPCHHKWLTHTCTLYFAHSLFQQCFH